LEVAEIKIGEKLNREKAIEQFTGRIEIISNGDKWFIPDFIDFQYGILNFENRAHNSVILILGKYGLIDESNKIKPLTSPLQGAKDKDKDKDTDKDKGGAGRINLSLNFVSEEIKIVWEKWVKYKLAEHKDKYKTIESEQEGINKLVELSGGDHVSALKIVNESIGSRYKGLFPLKQQQKEEVKDDKLRSDWTKNTFIK